ncbi:MAG: hypothetical protein ACRDPM_13385, partial [Solirubrobacteraceae bacterium]
LGDTVTFTYSEAIDPDTVLSDWDGSAQPVIVVIIDGGASSNDKLEVISASTLNTLPLGTIDLGRKDYVSATTAFGPTGTDSTMALNGNAIAVTLGTPLFTAGTAAGSGTLTWTPSSSVTDRAGNATSTTAVHETGTADKDF